MTDQALRTVTIARSRLQPWVDNFRARHGLTEARLLTDSVRLLGTDGAEATIAVPFPPLDPGTDPLDALIHHAARPRRVGAVLVRKGGFAVGVFEGDRLDVSKVGSAYVQGKTKAGGWSQQRYARRRGNQSRKAFADAAGEVVKILLPRVADLETVVTGGDKPALAAVFADPRLVDVRPLVMPQVFAVVDPRLRVLQAFPEQFLAVQIRLNALA